MGIKNTVKKIAGKAGDTVAKLSTLSPEQLEHVQEKRELYLAEKPDPTNEESEKLTHRWLASSAVEVYNAYLTQLKELYLPIKEDAEYDIPFDVAHNVRFMNITKWVVDKKENSLEKLVNVYQVLSNESCNISLIFNRTRHQTNVYLGITDIKNSDNNVDISSFDQRLKSAIKGNFPGSQWETFEDDSHIPCLNNDIPYTVASTTNIPTEKSEKFISQTIEKLLDGIVPVTNRQEYTIVLIATPIKDVDDRKLRLAELYSALSPYASWSTGYTLDQSDAFGSSATVGVNIGASVGSQAGQNQQSGTSDSESVGENSSESLSSGTSKTHTDTKGSSDKLGGSVSTDVSLKPLGVGVEGKVTASYDHTWNRSKADAIGKTITKGATKGVQNTLSKAVNKSAGLFQSHSLGGNFGANFSRSSSVTATIGRHDSINQSFTNYNIKHTLELLEEQMKRYEKSTALGLWDFGAYILSEDRDVANNVAHSYVALTQGEESYMSKTAINLWRGDMGENSEDAREICHYLRKLRHPIFGLNPELTDVDPTFNVYPAIVTATTALTGKELSYSLNFPQKSIAGLPVIECAEFGRNVISYDDIVDANRISLGKIFHMNHVENTPVSLSLKSLASHTFITGSTGSGKSNTVYQILNEAMKKNIHFLVVEPAKGEYKHAFSNDEDIHVYGTNPKLTELLKLNPFRFPDSIHVLEHIDRLVEIFNVCWPMYAAMPAVLKHSIEVSYEDCGWNLSTSTNAYGHDLYPNFKDVCRNIKTIIDNSDYDNENKGAYKGSLLTRLQSLTNGIYGMIFSNDQISDHDLFEEDVIVDLSRVGSTETKSLLMGLLVLRLQEYRMNQFNGTDHDLNHITVLEEAHNLLKRTSTEQSNDSSNLLGKSVEMITNAIAEMRTYGEGFIIADQAPGLLDMAVIRNTNTKIIMRLPDLSDRELVGKAANLNDDQINELAKLPLGVAAVYQNEWIQPVLCKINKAKVSHKYYSYDPQQSKSLNDTDGFEVKVASYLSHCELLDQNSLEDIKEGFKNHQIDASQMVAIFNWLKQPPKQPKMTKLAPMMSVLFPDVKDAIKVSYNESNDPHEWTIAAENALNKYLTDTIEAQVRRDIIQSIMTDYIYLEMNNKNALENWSRLGGLR